MRDSKDYEGVFPKRDVDRFTIGCPDCVIGRNSAELGGRNTCFHCDACGLIECEVTSPAVENGSISE